MINKFISSLRTCAAPVCLILITNGDRTSLLSAICIMVVATLLGYVGSYILSRQTKGAETDLIFHTVSDSIYHISIFLAFLNMGWMSLWLVFLIYSRDIIVPYLQSFSIQRGLNISDGNFGAKLKSILHGLCQIGVVAAALEILQIEGMGSDNLMFTLLIIAAGASIVSFISYIVQVMYSPQQTTEA